LAKTKQEQFSSYLDCFRIKENLVSFEILSIQNISCLLASLSNKLQSFFKLLILACLQERAQVVPITIVLKEV
jgi:hypothetical protein